MGLIERVDSSAMDQMLEPDILLYQNDEYDIDSLAQQMNSMSKTGKNSYDFLKWLSFNSV